MLLPALLRAQITTLQGFVADSASNLPIPYATIIINDNNTTGISADSTGHFAIKSLKPITALTFSFVGYKPQRILFNATDRNEWLNVFMIAQEQELENVTVLAGENPANRIIRAAVKNRELNNYANLNSYAYTAYEKFVVSGIPDSGAVKDSLHTKLFKYLDSNHLLIMESVVKRTHLAPDLTKELVIAQKVSGLQNPNFTVLTSGFKPLIFTSHSSILLLQIS